MFRRPTALAVALLALVGISTGTQSAATRPAGHPTTDPTGLPALVYPDTRPGDVPSFGTFAAYSPDGEKIGTRAWLLTEAGGNCCEVDVASTPTGRLIEFGGSEPYFSDDQGKTWSIVEPLTPLFNGEGAIVAGPNGDIRAVGWDTYGGDHLQSFAYDAASGAWKFLEIPLHTPFFDRPFVTVARGPFTINGASCPYATIVKGGYLVKTVELASCDGLLYDEVTTAASSSTATSQPLPATPDPSGLADYWSTPMRAETTPLSGQGLVEKSGSSCPVLRLQEDVSKWQCYSLPRGRTYDAMQQDSRGWLTTVTGGASWLDLGVSTDGGAHWSPSLTLLPPMGGRLEIFDVHVNGNLGLAVVDARFEDARGRGHDMVFRVDESTPVPRLVEVDVIGKGDVVTANGLTASGQRMDFMTITITPDGAIVGTYVDSTTHGAPAMFVEQGARTYRPDAAVKASASDSYRGDDVYNVTGIGQTVAVRQPRHTTRSYYVRVQNDGQAADRLAIIGPAGKPGLVVRYFAGGRDVTPSVINGSYVTGMLAPGAATVLRLVVSATADARVGSVTSWPLTVTSRANALSHDVVTTRITVAAD